MVTNNSKFRLAKYIQQYFNFIKIIDLLRQTPFLTYTIIKFTISRRRSFTSVNETVNRHIYHEKEIKYSFGVTRNFLVCGSVPMNLCVTIKQEFYSFLQGKRFQKSRHAFNLSTYCQDKVFRFTDGC